MVDVVGFGVPIRVLSAGDTFIDESECRRAESVWTRVDDVFPAFVVSRMRSFFCRVVDELEVVTLPFDESTRAESV